MGEPKASANSLVEQDRGGEARQAHSGTRRSPLKNALHMLGLSLSMLALSGCLLVSGEATTVDLQDGAGNLLTSFVGAEGRAERLVDLGKPDAEVRVIAILGVESGDLELALIQPDGAVAFVIAARPDAEVTRSGAVRANSAGQVRYRLSARGARNGSLQLFVQP